MLWKDKHAGRKQGASKFRKRMCGDQARYRAVADICLLQARGQGELAAGDREGSCMLLRPDGGIGISRYEADAPCW